MLLVLSDGGRLVAVGFCLLLLYQAQHGISDGGSHRGLIERFYEKAMYPAGKHTLYGCGIHFARH